VVAKIALEYDQSETTLLTALLHDTVEDTHMLLNNIEIMVGIMFERDVAQIVDAVTHLESNKKTFYKVHLSDKDNIFKLLEVKDKRACYAKLADRMHNMRTMQAKPYESQCSIAEETLRFFVPLAKKLGLKNAAKEHKERSLIVLD